MSPTNNTEDRGPASRRIYICAAAHIFALLRCFASSKFEPGSSRLSDIFPPGRSPPPPPNPQPPTCPKRTPLLLSGWLVYSYRSVVLGGVASCVCVYLCAQHPHRCTSWTHPMRFWELAATPKTDAGGVGGILTISTHAPFRSGVDCTYITPLCGPAFHLDLQSIRNNAGNLRARPPASSSRSPKELQVGTIARVMALPTALPNGQNPLGMSNTNPMKQLRGPKHATCGKCGENGRPHAKMGRSMAHTAHQPDPMCVAGGVSRWLTGVVVLGGGAAPAPPLAAAWVASSIHVKFNSSAK
jgi:hypothetical protein